MTKWPIFCGGLLLAISSISFAAPHKKTINTQPDSTIQFDFPQHPISIHIGGFFQATGNWFGGDTQNLENGVAIPNAALGITTMFGPKWSLNLKYNFAKNSNNIASGLGAANVDYQATKKLFFEAGLFYPSFGLSNDSDSNALTFLSEALVYNAFSPTNSTGIGLSTNTKMLVFVGDVFGPGPEKNANSASNLSVYGSTVRVFLSPVHTATKVLHFGLSYWFQQVKNSTTNFSTPPETNSINSGTLINTGAIKNMRYYSVLDGEFAVERGPWELQSEYLQTWVTRESEKSLRFSGYYLTSSYFLTGESRLYNFPDGAFTGISKIQSAKGAWQIAARYSTLNLNDQGVQGGQENDITLGLNWYSNNHIELMANYVRAMARPSQNGKNKNANVFTLQVQANF